MFGISSGELFFIAIIALIVLGPERLPKVTRFAGLWVRRARAQWYSVKDELERELAAEELKRSLREAQEAANDVERQVRESSAQAQREFQALRESVQDTQDTPAAAVTETETSIEADASTGTPAIPLPSQGQSDEPRNA